MTQIIQDSQEEQLKRDLSQTQKTGERTSKSWIEYWSLTLEVSLIYSLQKIKKDKHF